MDWRREVQYASDAAREAGEALAVAVSELVDNPVDSGLQARVAEHRAALRAGPALPPGEILGTRFRLLAPLGEAGLTSSWRAEDGTDGALVVLRVLDPQRATHPAARARFQAAAATATAVPDGMAALVAGPEEDLGYHYVARAWGERTLADLGPDDREAGVQLVVDAAEALKRVHDEGVAHGNLKPSNVVDCAVGGRATDPGLYVPGQVGTVYASPQLSDPSHVPDRLDDVYSIGMLLLRALVGRPLPFAVLRDPEPQVAAAGVGEALQEVLRTALSWDRDARPSDLGAVLDGVAGDRALARALAAHLTGAGRAEAALRYLRAELDEAASPELRLNYARALHGAGRDDEAWSEVEPLLDGESMELALAFLRELSDADATRWAAALERAAAHPDADAYALWVEVAELRAGELSDGSGASASWERALAAHKTRDQARRALWALANGAVDAEDEALWLGQVAGYVSDDELPAVAWRLGTLLHDELASEARALVWLERARAGGYTGDPELGARLAQLRASRGEWVQLRELAVGQAAEAEGEEAVALLRRAAEVARYAEGDPGVAEALYTELLAQAPEDAEALSWVGRRALRSDPKRGIALLTRAVAVRQTPEARVDAARLVEALVESGALVEAAQVADAALEWAGDDVSLWRLRAELAVDAGDLALAKEAWQRLERLGPARSGPNLGLAWLAWLNGDQVEAGRRARLATAGEPRSQRAWWAVTRVALSTSTWERPDHPWLAATPRCSTGQEVLARLVDARLQADAVAEWLALDPLGAAMAEALSDRPSLERAVAAVDLLERRGLVQTFCSELGNALPEDALTVLAVRDAVLGSDSPLRPEDTYAWSGRAHGFDPGVQREALPGDLTPGPGARHLAVPLAETWAQLLVPTEGALQTHVGSDDREDDGDRARQPVLVSDPGTLVQRSWPLDSSASVGSGSDDEVLVDTLPKARFRIERMGSDSYLLADEPVSVDGTPHTEIRLRGGEHLDADGVRFGFHLVGPVMELELDAEEEPPDEFFVSMTPLGAEPVIRRAALVFMDGDDEHMIPLAGEDCLVDGGAVVRRTDYGFELELADSEAVELLPDTPFEVGEREYRLRLLEIPSATPALALRRAAAPGQRVPVLIVDDGSLVGQPVMVDKAQFTIGRGRDVDLKLATDAQVSRHHCTILVGPDLQCVLRDHGSSNGTFVNDVAITEHLLDEGDVIRIGADVVEFRFGDRVALEEERSKVVAEEVDDIDLIDEATSIEPLKRKVGRPVSIREGKDKVRVANAALRPIIGAFDKRDGRGQGRAQLQLLLDGTSQRWRMTFESVEARTSGLPEMAVLFNVARVGDAEQRVLLNGALADLIDRAVSLACANFDEDAIEALLRDVAGVNYREHLRL